MATPEKDIERVQKNLDYVQEELLKRMNAFFGNANLGKNTDELVKQLKEWKLNIQKENSELKKRQKLVELVTKEDQDRLNNLKQINQEAKKPRGFSGFLERIGFTETRSEDLMATQYRARHMSSGLNALFRGDIGSGLTELLSVSKKFSNFMGGPYYLAIATVVKGLLKFDDALAKASKTAASITGGLQSQYVGKGLASIAYNAGLRNDLYKIGMQGQRDELMSALQKNYGYASYENNQREFINTMAYGQKGLSAYGIEGGSVNQLISNLRLVEGKNQQGVYAQLQRLTDRFNKMAIMSPEQALQQATSLYDQTKHLGTNFEWASRAIQKFEVGLKNGTISLNDFAAVNRALRGGGISKNTGIAAMVTDYAARSGINLPSEFINSNAIGQGFGISTRAMLRNNQFAKAYQGIIQEQLDQMGGATKLEKAGMLQYLLGQYGVNISPEMAENAIKSNGQIDLLGTNIIGTGAYVREKEEKVQADKYKQDVESYYKGTTAWHTQVLTDLAQLISNTGGSTAGYLDTTRSHANDPDHWNAGRVLAAILSVGGSEFNRAIDKKLEITINATGENQIPVSK